MLALDSFFAHGFRLLESLELRGLKRVNLIVGKNNSGKSALLEALRVYVEKADPTILLSLVLDRKESTDREEDAVPLEPQSHPLRHLFLNHALPEPSGEGIRLGRADDQESILHLRTAAYTTIQDDEGIRQTRIFPDEPLSEETEFRRFLVAEENGTVRRLLDLTHFRPGRLAFGPTSPRAARLRAKNISQFVPTGRMDLHEMAMLWDRTSLTPLENEVIKGLKLLEPKIEDIAFVEVSSRRRVPLARLSDSVEPIPLFSMGDGVARLFQLVLALVCARHGVLLVDEFENGLHWSVQERIWDIMFRLSETLDVQMFATTHSRDCVEAFEQSWGKHPAAGAFYRIERDDRDGTTAIAYPQQVLSDSVETGVEVR